jgi:hypothetical protein
MKVTAIIAPPLPGPHGPTVVPARQFNSVDEFVDALAKAAGISISVIEGSLTDAPDDGYIVAFEPPNLHLAQHPEIARRVFVVNADRASVLEDLEQYSLVGAIEKHRYSLWQRQPRQEEDGTGIFGRKDVAAGAPQSGRFKMAGYGRSARYDLLDNPGFPDLPSLLAGYLAAHAQLNRDAHGVDSW